MKPIQLPISRGYRGWGRRAIEVGPLAPGRSLLDMGRLLMDLQDLLGCRVQIAEPEGLHWYVRKRVLEEAVPL